MSENHRGPEVPQEEVPAVESRDGLARITLEELAITHFCEKWHPPESLFYKTKSGCRFGEKWSYAHRQADEQPSKRSKKNGDKSAVAMLKKYVLHDRTGQPVVFRDTRHEQGHGLVACNSSNTPQLGCAFQDVEPPKSSSILRNSSDIRKPIRCVKFTEAVARHADIRDQHPSRHLGCVFQDMKTPKSILRKSTNMPKPIQRPEFTKAIARHTKIRDQNPSLGYICPGAPHERNHNAPKFEDRSQEETEWQEQGARDAAWKLAKNVFKLEDHQRATFFSTPENRCLPASTLKPEDREFVVDSGASMHMISKKDLSNAEIDSLTKSCSPTTVVKANGEVQTHEERLQFYVKDLEKFLTMKVLEDTPAVLSLGKLSVENGYSYEWINGQTETISNKNGIRKQCNMENFVPIVVPGFWSASSSLQFSSFNLNDTFKTGKASFFMFLKLVYFTNYNSVKRQ